ncbi:hypothetical protein TWF106_010006 [Orbilia oligospora]|uniref:F-box domain-containing protein n=1 Tax=Orbilia oligospora TaxID=2813651 RepID=A0A7C8QGH0_ORBOL|nr:hypothetical protein TWF106_010006 [Orbilia oligospora]
MSLPCELVEQIFNCGHLSRSDLWSFSLVCRQWNAIVTPVLYKSIIIEFRCGIAIPKNYIRSLFTNQRHHSSLHLVRNVVLLAEYEDRNASTIWEDGVAAMVNELMEGFLRRLGNAQLRSFIWRSHLEMSSSLLTFLANNQGTTLNCLYIDGVEYMENMEHNPDLSKFTSINTLRWNGLLLPREIEIISQIMKASASTIQTVSFGIIHPRDKIRGQLQMHRLERLDLPALVEYQAPLRVHADIDVFNIILPLSQLQRLYITEIGIARRGNGIDLFTSIKGLVELHYVYDMTFERQTSLAIFSHGKTLKRLYLCADISRPTPLVLSASALQEIGERCPNLVELGITRSIHHSPNCIRADDCSCFPVMILFPLHAFTKLEVLFLSVQLKGPSSMIEDTYFANEALVRAIKCGLESTLNRELSDPMLVKRSNNLKIVAMGAGAPELHRYPRTQARPRLWRVDHHDATGKGPITLHPTTFDDIDNGNHSWYCARTSGRKDCHDWKLLRRYPLLIPNEGL